RGERGAPERVAPPLPGVTAERLVELDHLLARLAPRVLPARPVEPHAPRLHLQPLRPQEGGQAPRDAFERRPGRAVAPGLVALDALPLGEGLSRVGHDVATEDAGMPAGH